MLLQGISPSVDKEIIERLTRLEEGQVALKEGLKGGQIALNKRIDDLSADILFWLEMIFGGIILILAGIFTHGILLWRRQTRIS